MNHVTLSNFPDQYLKSTHFSIRRDSGSRTGQIPGSLPAPIELKTHGKEKPMQEILVMIAIVGVWYLLQAHILPKLGIPT